MSNFGWGGEYNKQDPKCEILLGPSSQRKREESSASCGEGRGMYQVLHMQAPKSSCVNVSRISLTLAKQIYDLVVDRSASGRGVLKQHLHLHIMPRVEMVGLHHIRIQAKSINVNGSR